MTESIHKSLERVEAMAQFAGRTLSFVALKKELNERSRVMYQAPCVALNVCRYRGLVMRHVVSAESFREENEELRRLKISFYRQVVSQVREAIRLIPFEKMNAREEECILWEIFLFCDTALTLEGCIHRQCNTQQTH